MEYLSEKQIKHTLETFNPETAKIIANGKSKTIFATNNKNIFLMEFKPSLRSITYKRQQNIQGTELERMKSCLEIYLYLGKYKVKTQLLFNKIIILEKYNNKRYFLAIKAAKQIPLEWISRFYAAGSLTKLFPTLVKEGQKLKIPLQKYDFKQDESIAGVDDPTMNESYMTGLNLITEEELDICKYYLSRISLLLQKKLDRKNLKLVDLKMEFGKNKKGNIMLTDEISQDCMRVNNQEGNSITKDAFRQWKSENDVLAAYQRFSKEIGFKKNKFYHHKE